MPTVPSIRAAALLLVCGALALPLAACGSSGGGGESPAATADDARDTAQLKLQQCLKENGVDVGQRGGQGGPPSDTDRQELQEAIEGPCEDLANGAFGSVSDEDRAEFEDARVRLTACLKEHGIDLPEPNGDRPALTRIDADDEDVQEAIETCRDELPANLRNGPGPGGGFGGGPQ